MSFKRRVKKEYDKWERDCTSGMILYKYKYPIIFSFLAPSRRLKSPTGQDIAFVSNIPEIVEDLLKLSDLELEILYNNPIE